MRCFARFSSPLGSITAASDGEALTGLWFEGQARFPAAALQGCEERALPVFDETGRWLALYFDGAAPGFTPPLRPEGSAFQLAVWAQLLTIPWGQTGSYGALARTLGTSPRAVGSAVGRNPISLIIPCHRVIGANGRLTGYAGGLWRKQALLTLEGVLKQEDI